MTEHPIAYYWYVGMFVCIFIGIVGITVRTFLDSPLLSMEVLAGTIAVLVVPTLVGALTVEIYKKVEEHA